MKKLGIVVLILLILGGGYYFYEGGLDPLGPSQEEITGSVENTAEAMREDSLVSEAELSLSFAGLAGGLGLPQGGVITGEKRSELNLPEEFKIQLEGEFEDEGETMTFSGAGELLFAENNLYGKLEAVPLPLRQMDPEMMDVIMDEYIRLEEDIDLEEGLDEMEEELQLAPELEEEFDEADVDMEDVEDLWDDFLEGVWREEVVEVTDSYDCEIMEVTGTRHELVLNLDRLPGLVEDLVEEYEEDIPQLKEEEFQEDLEEMKEELSEWEDEDMEGVDMDFSLLTDDNYLVGIDFQLEVEEFDEGEMDSFGVDYKQTFSEFGEEFEIESPEDYMTEEEIMQEMMGPGF